MPDPMHIIIVDDEHVITSEIAEYVIGRGACPAIANSAEDALRCLRDGPGTTVLLSDIRMPGRNGLSLLSLALAERNEAQAIEVVLMTGHATLDDAITALQRKAFDFVRKPFRLAALWETLERAHAAALTRRSMAAMHQGLPAASPVPVVAADRVIPAATTGEPARERQAIQAELAAAVGNHHLTLHYQPQVDLGTGQVCGAEALLRWNRPGHGLVPPGHFIDVAEDSGLILPIGQWVVHEACQRAAIWPRHLGIAVNVSPLQFRDPGLYKAVLDAIRGSGIMPSRLELEITERMMLPDSEETLATLRRLRELGVRLAMDDFGTGYSGLGYLQRFRFDKVKIDRSFTCRLGEDPSAAAIVRAVVGLAESLGLCVNAEGVETALQDETLRSLGCSEGQGFLYGRPVPHEVFNAKHLEAAPEIGTLSAAPATGPPG